MSIESYPSPNGVLTSLIWRKTMSGGETSLSGYDNASQALSYTPGQEQVYLNGILLVRGDDYTATNGTSITGLTALAASDFVQINCYNNFSVATTPATSITGTIANNQLANSGITINSTAVALGGTITGLANSADVIAKSLTTTTGDIIYASGANTPARLGIGSTGQLLGVSGGVPAWTAAPSSGGQTLISTTTMNTTNISLTGLSGYNDIKIVLRNPYFASGYSSWRVNDNGASIYRPSILRADNSTTFYSLPSAVTTAFNLSPSNGPLVSNAYSTVVITIFDYNNTSSYKVAQQNEYWGNWGGNVSSGLHFNTIQTLDAITSIQLTANWVGGTCLVYGVK